MRNACHANVPSKMIVRIHFQYASSGCQKQLLYVEVLEYRYRGVHCVAEVGTECAAHVNNCITQYGRARKRLCHARLGT